MTGNGIGIEGTKSVSEALKTNTTLTELNMGGEKWGKKKEETRNVIEENVCVLQGTP